MYWKRTADDMGWLRAILEPQSVEDFSKINQHHGLGQRILSHIFIFVQKKSQKIYKVWIGVLMLMMSLFSNPFAAFWRVSDIVEMEDGLFWMLWFFYLWKEFAFRFRWSSPKPLPTFLRPGYLWTQRSRSHPEILCTSFGVFLGLHTFQFYHAGRTHCFETSVFRGDWTVGLQDFLSLVIVARKKSRMPIGQLDWCFVIVF